MNEGVDLLIEQNARMVKVTSERRFSYAMVHLTEILCADEGS